VWKDIIRFHWIYWPAMLKSAWYELPKNILTTGFFTVDWQKISKSLWNAIDPVEFSNKYSKDLLALYLLSSFNIWQDWDFDQKQAILTYNAKLANNLWNLVNRVVVLSLKLQENSWILDWESNQNWLIKYIKSFDKNLKEYNLKKSIDESFKFLDEINNYTTEKEPWKTIKENENETTKVLYIIAEWLRQVGLNLYVFFPEKMTEMFEKLGLQNYKNRLENWDLEKLREEKVIFEIKEKWNNLFERIDIK
jgi:methionyl-tRNA synthetase